MRALLTVVYGLLFYYAVSAVLRWLFRPSSFGGQREGAASAQGELVRDPECGVYILKERAVTRRVKGSALYFCGEACAAAHAARNGG